MAATSPLRANIRGAVVGACGLLGLSGATAAATEVDVAVLGYSEPDRVSALETIVDAQHTFADGKMANLRIVLDALTGASASGAVPAPFAQTFTRPSGQGS